MKDAPYSSLVGGLMHAMVCSLLNIAHTVGIINRFMYNPGKEHWNAAKWILRYLHGTREKRICFEKNYYEGIDKFSVEYVDSDFAGDLDKRRSTPGYVFTMAKGTRNIGQTDVLIAKGQTSLDELLFAGTKYIQNIVVEDDSKILIKAITGDI
ncbi:unnamed protein product [Prunus brigantina]